MKFKYIGQLPIKNADLVLAGIFKSNEVIMNGTIFEVPNDNPLLIQRLKSGGNYVEYHEPKKMLGKLKSENKKETKKEDKKETKKERKQKEEK